MSAVDAVRVANAALAEVGLPEAIAMDSSTGRLAIPQWLNHADPIAHRAGLLGLMAEHGPAFLVRCRPCMSQGYLVDPCTAVREALRGATCGSAA